MRRLMFSLVCLVLFGASALAQAQRTSPQLSFDKAKFESGINAAFNAKDANAVGKYLASNYNEAGASKDMVIRQMAELFQKADVQVRFRMLDFHQFADTKVGYARVLTEMTVSTASGRKTLRTAGYAGLVNENGVWALTSVACGISPDVLPSGMPDVDNPNIEWVGWGSLLNPASIVSDLISESNRPRFSSDFDQSFAGLPKFDRAKWEQTFTEGWDKKNAAEILSQYVEQYTEFGLDRSGIKAAMEQTFKAYDRIDCKYHVLAISYIPGTNLASIKAVFELKGVPKGSTELTTLLQAAGYASLVAEQNVWKVYAVQTSAAPDIGLQSWEELTTKQWPIPLN